MFATILAWLVMRSALAEVTRERGDRAVLVLLGLGVVIIATGVLRWRGIGFPVRDASRLLFGPTVGSTFWSQPHVSSVLLTRPDAAAACATPMPDSARAMVHAIEDAAGQLVGHVRAAGSSAAEAAHLLLSDIERLDGEIENLVGDADPEELARIERRLSQMNETQRDARRHLEEYARIMRSQTDLADVKRYDREDANGTLRTIWTVLERLREHSGRGPSRETELVQQLESLAAAARDRSRPAGH
jgi:hypothetical protein